MEEYGTREMTREELIAENNELRAKLEELTTAAKTHTAELRYRDGVIYGLKFATRCNGVSGGDVIS